MVSKIYIELLLILCREQAIYEKVDEVDCSDVQLSKNPAYEGVTFT